MMMTVTWRTWRAAGLLGLCICCCTADHKNAFAGGKEGDLGGPNDLTEPGDLTGAEGVATCRHGPSLECAELSCSGRGVIDCRDRQSSIADTDVIHSLATSFYLHLKSTLLAGFIHNKSTPHQEHTAKPHSHGSDGHGSDSHGSEDHGSESHGSHSHGLDSHGSEDHGSEDHGSDSHGSDSQGSEDHGSAGHGSHSHGSDSHGMDSHGSANHGPEGHRSAGHESTMSKQKADVVMPGSQADALPSPDDRHRYDTTGLSEESPIPRKPAVVDIELNEADAEGQGGNETKTDTDETNMSAPNDGRMTISNDASTAATGEANAPDTRNVSETPSDGTNVTAASTTGSRNMSSAPVDDDAYAEVKPAAGEALLTAGIDRSVMNGSTAKRRRRSLSSVTADPTGTERVTAGRPPPGSPSTATSQENGRQEMLSEDQEEAEPVPSRLIFGKVGGNSSPHRRVNAGRGGIVAVNSSANSASRKTLLYQVRVQTGVNESQSESRDPSAQMANESTVTWIKPLEETQKSEVMPQVNKEGTQELRSAESTPAEGTMLLSSPQNASVTHPPSHSSSVTMAASPSADGAPQMSTAPSKSSLQRPDGELEDTTDKMDPMAKTLSVDSQNQATNSSFLPEQLEQFQQILVHFMEEDDDFKHADKEKVRALLLQQTQFPYLAGTVQPGGSVGACTLYNITCQPQAPLLANCTGISPVVCVDLPGKVKRTRSEVFHLVLQLLVGACVLFLPLIWIICRKQPNEVVANSNI